MGDCKFVNIKRTKVVFISLFVWQKIFAMILYSCRVFFLKKMRRYKGATNEQNI